MASAAGGGTGVGAAGADELAAAPAVFSIANGSDHAEGALPVQPVVSAAKSKLRKKAGKDAALSIITVG